MYNIVKFLDRVKDWLQENTEPADRALLFFVICAAFAILFRS